MSDIINLLPEALANQIAAGEVVQRPSSVVKELLENAIDAGATELELIVKDAGKSLVQVVDNGKGMSDTDVRMCFERHATSKLKTTEDLFNIRTMGFRGEAMASIAAVAQVELISKESEDELGSRIEINGSELQQHEPEVCETGTSILVKNLFFNVPARRNFLKSNAVELKHIVEEFQRVALTYADISFRLVQNDMELMILPQANLSQRIVSIFGKSYQQQLVAVNESTDHVSIHGFVGKPESAKKTRGEQYFFANNRFIKSPYLNHAVLNAFEGLLAEGSHPFYVLFIEIDPKHIDINVHPTKTEIKFDDERTIYAIMQASVRQAIGLHNVTPSIDFDLDINFGKSTAGKRDYDDSKSPFKNWTPPSEKNNQNIPQKIGSLNISNPTQHPDRSTQKWETLFQGFEKPDPLQEDLTFESKLNETEKIEKPKTSPEAIFQLKKTWIVTQTQTGLLLVDQKSAHERVLFEKNLRSLEQKKGVSQQVLFPQQLSLTQSDLILIKELKTEISELGFQFEEFGGNAIVIQGVPNSVSLGNEKELFEGLIEQYKWNCKKLNLDKNESLAQALAKRSALKHGHLMQPEEMNSLIGQLFGCNNPNYTPEGKPTFVILEPNTIENYFNS